MSKKALDTTNLLYLASAPTTPAPIAGDIYYDTTLAGIYVYSGSAWVASAAGSSGATLGAANVFTNSNTFNTSVSVGTTLNVTGNTTLTGTLAAQQPITLTSNTLVTAASGALEYDGKAFYSTASATAGRGVTPSIIFAHNSATKALTSATGNQAIFATPTTGALTVAGATTYLYDGIITLNTGTTTTHTVSFNFGGTATFTSADIFSTFLNVANGGTPTAATSVHIAAATGGVISPTGVLATKTFTVRGTLRVNASGTIIPQIAFSAAPGGTNTVGINSYISFSPIGSNTVTSSGAWA